MLSGLKASLAAKTCTQAREQKTGDVKVWLLGWLLVLKLNSRINAHKGAGKFLKLSAGMCLLLTVP